ncbi:MAG: TRAP transporter substrate-binding protein DctP [Spirochaetaceae bacterium]|jgi:TRAP-type C4-dicarboxylate transport system substrate-binding protein|nr:TRAP transporter substrate-binding protein DctP [Spirochaetaceae bacterium]GMO27173.1 MAG: hypothetical protein Pg6A_14680 [Termitinemataceae bacterium]
MKKNYLFCLLLFEFCFSAAFVHAQKVKIKLASIAPKSTDWGRALDKMANEWSAATGGDVEIIVYHNGVLGSDEAEVLKKLRMNQIQAAVFTSAGMSAISKKIWTLSAPFLIRSDEEMDYVLPNVSEEFETEMEASGFKLISWSRVGWIKFFSRRPAAVPSELKSQTIGGNSSITELNNILKNMGYTLLPVANNDMLVALTSGKIDSYYLMPAYAAAMQIFGIAKNMLPLDIAPVIGGIVMNQSAWRQIPERHKNKLLQIARRIAKENDIGAQKLNNNAIETMKRNGLVVTSLSKAQEQLWFGEAEAAMPSMLSARGSVLDAGVYRRVDSLLRDYRSKQNKQ